MSNMNFLIADVIQFVSGTVITFSAKIKSEQFSEFDSRTMVVVDCSQSDLSPTTLGMVAFITPKVYCS